MTGRDRREGQARATSMIRVLVVDDDAVAARLHAGYVSALPGFTVVTTVGSGEAALGVIGSGAVDLVLLDISLPGFSGIEVLHRLRTGVGAQVDVLVVSSARDRVTVRQALSSQVIGYLVKPFSRDALRQRLERYRSERGERAGGGATSFGQGEIDALLEHRTRRAAGPAAAEATTPLPKGLSAPTMDAVLDVLRRGGPRTAGEIASACGASRVTVRRYLEYLDGTGLVDISHRYGGRGRPEMLYRLVP